MKQFLATLQRGLMLVATATVSMGCIAATQMEGDV